MSKAPTRKPAAPPAPKPAPRSKPKAKPKRKPRSARAAPPSVGSPPPDLGGKKASGSANRARAAAAPTAAGQPTLKGFPPAVRQMFDRLGPPPMDDPLELTCWQQNMTGIATYAYATGRIGPSQHARLKGILESVRTGGMVAVKAQERKRQKDIAKRVGAVTEHDDGLDEFPAATPDLG